MNSADGLTGWYKSGIQPEGATAAVYKNKQKVSKLTNVYGDVVTCTAQWTKFKYTISYNKNSGKGSMASKKVEYDEITTLSACKITRSGYTFNGWNVYRKNDKKYLYVSTDGTTDWYKSGKQPTGWNETVLADQAEVTGLSLVNGDTITMYAIWKKKA